MGMLEGKMAIVTGAGRGLGRSHALSLAREGARVIVNDLGSGLDGSGREDATAREVVEEIRAAGGEAIANHDDVASWEGAQRLVRQAVDELGRLDVLVDNAGILRDRMCFVYGTTIQLIQGWQPVAAVGQEGGWSPARVRDRMGELFRDRPPRLQSF